MRGSARTLLPVRRRVTPTLVPVRLLGETRQPQRAVERQAVQLLELGREPGEAPEAGEAVAQQVEDLLCLLERAIVDLLRLRRDVAPDLGRGELLVERGHI